MAFAIHSQIMRTMKSSKKQNSLKVPKKPLTKKLMYNEQKIEKLIEIAKTFAYPENMLGVRKENGMEESFLAGSTNACHKETFEKCDRFEIFVGKEEIVKLREALSDVQRE